MFYQLKSVFPANALALLNRNAHFVDATDAARHRGAAAQVGGEQVNEAVKLIRQGLLRSKELHALARPKTMSRPGFLRYAPDMDIGGQVVEAILAGQTPTRADVSCAVFLSDPASYEGGELVVKTGNETHTIKGAAGDVAMYSSTSRYHMTPVTRGEMRVALVSFQSMIRDQQQRELLVELQGVLDEFILNELDNDLAVRLSYVRANLVRMWSDV